MDTLNMFAAGAAELAALGEGWTPQHAAAGLSEAEWRLLTQPELWTAAQRRRARGALADAVNVSLERAQLPSEPLPGQYVAACICQIVAPCNRLVAAHRVPETYCAVSASGLVGPVEVRPMPTEQMVSLVIAYTHRRIVQPAAGTRWSQELVDALEREDQTR